MTIKEFDKETEKIIETRIIERRKLERDQINKHIAERDARRAEKQRLEDMGLLNRPRYYPPEPEPEPEPVIEEKIIEAKKEFIEKVEKMKEERSLPPPPKLPPAPEIIEEILKEEEEKEELKRNDVLAAQKELREAVIDAKKSLNSSIEELEHIKQEWIDEYNAETGKNAIWNGKITEQFKKFCKEVLNIDIEGI